jgi:hypothetical protein
MTINRNTDQDAAAYNQPDHNDRELIEAARRKRRREMRRARVEAMRDLGLVRVRGSHGGIYWE